MFITFCAVEFFLRFFLQCELYSQFIRTRRVFLFNGKIMSLNQKCGARWTTVWLRNCTNMCPLPLYVVYCYGGPALHTQSLFALNKLNRKFYFPLMGLGHGRCRQTFNLKQSIVAICCCCCCFFVKCDITGHAWCLIK